MHAARIPTATDSSSEASAPNDLATGRLSRIGRWLAAGGAASLILATLVLVAFAWILVDVAPRFSSAPLRLPLQHTLWSSYGEPAVSTIEAGSPVELGVVLRPAVAGTIVGLRFYKFKGDSGPHVGSLWTAKGKRLATVTFTDETESGWQEAQFDTPVPVDAHRPLVASYFAPVGGQMIADASFPDSGAPMTSGSTAFRIPPSNNRPANTYHLGASGFPSSDAGERAIWVDVVFVPATADR